MTFKGIDQLRKLTETLSSPRVTPIPFSAIVSQNREDNSVIEIDKGKDGKIVMTGLLKTKDIAVSHVIATANSWVEPHNHDEWECFIIYRGVMVLDVDGKYVELGVGDMYKIGPNISHDASWPEETEMICITIPASNSFPEAKNG
jgi:mannose-6-phosphate isomerase-like protein (cupin superfamily)